MPFLFPLFLVDLYLATSDAITTMQQIYIMSPNFTNLKESASEEVLAICA